MSTELPPPPVLLGANLWSSTHASTLSAETWVTIYPAYLDSRISSSRGRRIAASHAVEAPVANEIFHCARGLGFDAVLQADKAYPRDTWVPGRVKVRAFEDGAPLLGGVSRRVELFREIARVIPEYRKGAERKAGKKGGAVKGGAAKGGAKGVSAPKKKKKGKR